MSKLLQNPKYTPKQLESQWINTVFGNHDLFCSCDDPITHLLIVLNRQGKAQKPEDDIKNIKCLITGDPKDTEDVIDTFQDGELDALFAEDSFGQGDEPGTSGDATG